MPSPTGMQIYDPQGHRLYLTGSERAAFRTAAEAAPREVRTYCWTLLYSGCRPSEALALTADRVDFQAAILTFASKKKRRPGLYRAVPVPATLLDALDLVHGLRDRATQFYLWTWSLKTAYTRVIEIMARGRYRRSPSEPQRAAAWLWRGLYRKRDSAQSRAALAGPCAALHDRDLCRRGGRRGAPYCRPPLDLTRGNLMGQILWW